MKTLKPYNYIVVDNVGTCRRFDYFSAAYNFARGLSTGNRRDVIVTLISYLTGVVTHFTTDKYGNSCYLDDTLTYMY